MGFGDIIDRAIEPFAPRTAARRKAARMSLDSVRQYEAARSDRRTQGWKRPSTSQDAEGMRGIIPLRNGARDLVRNNKYAAAALQQMTAHAIGDGIAPQALHPEKPIAQAAQDAWDRWAEGKVDGQNDFYGVEKLSFRSMAEGGESLLVWKPDANGPDGRVLGLEGDHLDLTKITARDANGARIVQGVQLDADQFPAGYWLFDDHPGDLFAAGANPSRLVAAAHVDHVFHQLRWGQRRGVSWLGAVALTLRDIADIEDATRLKKKVAACVAMVLSSESETESPLLGEVENKGAGKQDFETMRPGMVARLPKGVQASILNPTSTDDGVEFIRQSLAGVSASLVPYHLMTGDVSNANYSSLRAAMLGFWSLLDDWQQNIMIPQVCRPAFDRRMRRLAMEAGDRRFLQVRATFAMPVRRYVDPVKDLLAEIMEIRSGLKLISQSLAERGINGEEHMKKLSEMNTLIDSLQLVLDSDPRKTNDAGSIQAAVGYLSKNGGGKASD